jgi:hypothetical protein
VYPGLRTGAHLWIKIEIETRPGPSSCRFTGSYLLPCLLANYSSTCLDVLSVDKMLPLVPVVVLAYAALYILT